MSGAVPKVWSDRLESLARGEVAAPARPAATVVLLREGGGTGPEAYLLRRRASLAFAAGAYAFPGGGVDARDADAELRWAGEDAAVWGRRLGLLARQAQAVVCAAVRETFEESGVLLAGVDGASVLADVSGPEWARDRAALEAHELGFAEFLARRGLVLRSDLLGAWSRWITPEFEPRRYDTWFFVAAVPPGQRALETVADSEAVGEADRVVWAPVADAVARCERGEYLMLPPTVSTLRELADCADPADALRRAATATAGRPVAPVQAHAVRHGDGWRITWPGHPELTLEGTAPTPEGSPAR